MSLSEPDNVLDIDLERALQVFAEAPEKGARAAEQGTAKTWVNILTAGRCRCWTVAMGRM